MGYNSQIKHDEIDMNKRLVNVLCLFCHAS